VNTAVILFKLEVPQMGSLGGGGQIKIVRVANLNHNFLCKSLVDHGSNIFLGDLFQSISLLRVSGKGEAMKLEVVAKCYTSHFPVAIDVLDGENVIGGDLACNIFTYRVQKSRDKQTIEREGTFHVSDTINKFILGSLLSVSSDDPEQAQPQTLFFTNVGRIGVISEFEDDRLSLSMTDLQRNLAGCRKGVGGRDHSDWRRPVNEYGHSDDVQLQQAIGFLDGDFLEMYLAEEGEGLERVREGKNEAESLTIEHGRLVRVLEKLQSLH